MNDLRKERERIAKFKGCISAGERHTVGLKTNGSVVAIGSNKDFFDCHSGQCDVSGWRDIVAISAGSGSNIYWKNTPQETFVSCTHTFGLKVDGTVVVSGGWNSRHCTDRKGQKDRCKINDWRNIIEIAAGGCHIVGFSADRIKATGLNHHGQCGIDRSDWEGIISVSAGDFHTVGLKSDGTVVAVGENEHGQCDVSDWRDIVAIAAGKEHTAGLKSDGTVVVASKYIGAPDWQDIVAIAAGFHLVGLKADGTVVTVLDKDNRNVSGWRDIVAIAAGKRHTVGLKADGTVVAAGENKDGQCNVSDWRGIGPVSKEELQLRAKRRSQGLCENCGGEMTGFFIFKKCSESCGG